MVRNMSSTSSINGSPSLLINSIKCSRRNKRKRSKRAQAQETVADLPLTKSTKEPKRCFESNSLALVPVTAAESPVVAAERHVNVAVEQQILDNKPDVTVPHDIVENLQQLIMHEAAFHPKTDFLFRINSAIEDKVDANQRDEAIFNLRFLHKFYNLSPMSFALAVNIADRFIVKVKVKPKYMACLATAAYLIATKMVENNEDVPSYEKLVLVARCGGSANDLERMESIIRSKLQLSSLQEAVTSLHFLLSLEPFFPDARSFERAICDLEICLCSVAVYSHRPALLALCIACQYWPECGAGLLLSLAALLQVSESELLQCKASLSAAMRKVQCRSPTTPRALVWQLSRRTLSCLQKPSALAIQLQPITEDWLEEENLEIARLFD